MSPRLPASHPNLAHRGKGLCHPPTQVPLPTGVPAHRCGLLNCEAVLELLIRQLGGASERVQMVRPGSVGSGRGIVTSGVCSGGLWEGQ